ncbi:MAG: TPP-binding protein [Acetobacteraceae bacterium]|nr:TPP-binding protein [Acetobacteraceae bacterium]
MNTAEALVEGLIANGIGTLYALPGVQNDPFFDALFHAQDRLRVVHTRHEQATGYMALGAAMATGQPQAMCVVPGPGFLNAASALATAYSGNAPVLAILGQVPLHEIGRNTGALHEIVGQSEILRTVTKWSSLVRAPGEVPALVAEAFRQMRSGRPRPAGLEVPMDIWQRTAAIAPQHAAEPIAPPPVDEDAVEEAAKLLGKAERPLILVGGGAHGAREAVRTIAEALTAPVMAFRMGRGVMDSRHPLDCTLPVGHRFWAEADVVLMVGTRAQNPLMSWGVDSDLKIIRVDIDAEEMTRHGLPTVGLHGDAAPILAALADRIGRHNRARPGRAEHVAQVKAEVMGRLADRLAPQLAYVRAIREALPENGVFVDELTQVSYVARITLPVYRPRTFLASGLQGTLGWGFATALGAKVALGDSAPVLSVNGDGGFMFNVQELATAVHHRIPVVAVVFNDRAYGNVRAMQKHNFGNRLIASELTNPDFVRLAESFGAQGLRARTPEELRAAIERGFATTDGPTLIEVPVGEMPSPWGFIKLPQVRPAKRN